MSTLVTLGCSFSQGDGCYDIDTMPENCDNNNKDFQEYRENNMDRFNKNSIGANLQKRFGYETFINYGYAGSSNESQLLNFFNNLPNDENVTIFWQLTFYDRAFEIIGRGFHDAGQHRKWVLEKIEEKVKSHNQSLPQMTLDSRIETILRINVLKEYCIARGWNLFIWSWTNDGNGLISIQPSLSEILVNFKNKIHEYSDDLPNEYKSPIPNDSHPNEKGYKLVSDDMCNWIDKNNHRLKVPMPNEIPLEQIKVSNNQQIKFK
jgi:hypothetical protein